MKNRYIAGIDPFEGFTDVIITDSKCGDILIAKEDNILRNYPNPHDEETDFIKSMDNEFKDADWADEMVWRNLEDKFKTTDLFKRVSKSFRIQWSKVFKRGFLIFK